MHVFGSGRRWWRGGEWMRGVGFGHFQSCVNRMVLDVSLCFGCGDVGGV